MTNERNLEAIHWPQSINGILENDSGLDLLGALEVQRVQTQQYIKQVCGLLNIEPCDLHQMGSDEIHRRLEGRGAEMPMLEQATSS